VVFLVIVAVAIVLHLKQADSSSSATNASGAISIAVLTDQSETRPPASQSDDEEDADRADAALPQLLDLGADKCIPCKKMAPILETLRKDFAGQFEVVFIDVWRDRQAAVPYRIKLIPTQIFFDEEGNELLRHEGFFSREDILQTWATLGYSFRMNTTGAAGQDRRTRVLAYYFHGTLRCDSCLAIEAQARDVISSSFAEAMSSGALEWRAVDYDLDENRHYAEDFDLAHSSLVLIRVDGEMVLRWEVLEGVWDHLEDAASFASYVRNETSAFLEEGA
jgi:thioredoxin 1